jgi:formylglycine-generating enzyme required for sulfatase activity/serine/threonine protein kinase
MSAAPKMSQPNDPFDLIGTVLANKYRIDAVVGEGGFGVVYRGFHVSFQHEIAVKCLKIPPHFTPDAQILFVSKFREEGQHLSRLSSAHFSIVRVFDFDVGTSPRGGSMPYLVLEWLKGRSLEDVLEERRAARVPPFGEREALALLRPAVEALAVAHGMGVAHRDIKPPNLFVIEGAASATTMKLLDFGIAKAMQEGETATQVATRTTSGFSAFSPQYGAPEQFRAKKFGATGPWTDVHALGLVLAEMVTGRLAFEGEDQGDFFEASTSEARPTPRAKGAIVSDAFEALCAKALARMPKERFASAKDLLEAMDGLGGEAASSSRATPAVALATAPTALPESAPPRAPSLPRLAAPEPAQRAVARGNTTSSPQSIDMPLRSGTELAPGAPSIVEGIGPPRPKIPGLPAGGPATPAPTGGGGLRTVGIAAVVVVAVSGLGIMLTRKSTPSDGDKTGPSTATSTATTTEVSAPAAATAAVPAPTSTSCPADMAEIPGGTFQMGSSDGSSEKPVHAVTLSPYCMDLTEVTVGAYAKCTSCRAPDTAQYCNKAGVGKDDHPQNCVAWDDAVAYCKSAGKRLPTEAEWEYAARGGSEGRKWPWGETPPTKATACFDRWSSKEGTCKVGSYPSGAFGLKDMAGNVWEWVSDWYGGYPDTASKDYAGPSTGSRRVRRGGSWNDVDPSYLRGANRGDGAPGDRNNRRGARCARTR